MHQHPPVAAAHESPSNAVVRAMSLKAHKGTKFKYFEEKPSSLPLPPIPNYFTRALE